MKRRSRAVRRASPRRSFFGGFGRKKSRSKGSSSVNPLQFDAMVYGAVRGYAANLIQPVTNMIPLGEMSDEIGMGLLNWVVAKNTSGMVRDVCIKGLVVENARVGERLISGGMGIFQSTQSTSNFGY